MTTKTCNMHDMHSVLLCKNDMHHEAVAGVKICSNFGSFVSRQIYYSRQHHKTSTNVL